WPGNIRELRHAIVQAVLRCPSGGHLESRHFSLRPASEQPASTTPGQDAGDTAREPTGSERASGRSLQDQIDQLESSAIATALAASGGNKTRAAELLGISRYGLTLKLKRLGSRKH